MAKAVGAKPWQVEHVADKHQVDYATFYRHLGSLSRVGLARERALMWAERKGLR